MVHYRHLLGRLYFRTGRTQMFGMDAMVEPVAQGVMLVAVLLDVTAVLGALVVSAAQGVTVVFVLVVSAAQGVTMVFVAVVVVAQGVVFVAVLVVVGYAGCWGIPAVVGSGGNPLVFGENPP